MLKLWLVTFSNGEEWHIFGEKEQVIGASIVYASYDCKVESITFVRAYRR